MDYQKFIGFTLILIGIIFSGCSTPIKYENHKNMFAVGLYKESIVPFEEEMVKREKKAGLDADGNQLPVRGSRAFALDDMEMGAAFRVMGGLEESNKAFSRSEDGIREQQEASKIGGAIRQVGAVFSNDNSLPYQIQEYDSIMVNTYKALNLLEQGEIDKTRVEFNRVSERQRMAVVRFQEQIAKAKAEEAKEIAKGENVEAIENNVEEAKNEGEIKSKIKNLIAAKFTEAKDVVMGSMREGENKEKLSEYEKSFSVDAWGVEDAFTNPFATYMHGLFLLVYGEDKSDAESSVHLLERACKIEKDKNKSSAAVALSLANDLANGKIKRSDLNNKVFVIFENGVCPEKQEYTIPLIIPLNLALSSGQKFVDATLVLPKLVSRDVAYPFLSIRDGSNELARTSFVCNMDSVVAAEYRERMPAILTRNIIQCGVKAVLQVMIVNELTEQGVPAIVASAAVSAMFNATKAADTRIWASLPKNFQVAVVDRPSSGKLLLCAPDEAVSLASVDIPEDKPSIVFIKTPSTGVTPRVSVVSK